MEVGVLEAKNRLSELIERAEHGEPVTITRHGKAVVTMNAVRKRPSREKIEQLVRDIAEDRKKLPPISREEIIDAVKSGRRF